MHTHHRLRGCRTAFALLSMLGAVLGSAACGGSGGQADMADMTGQAPDMSTLSTQACTDWAKATCAKLDQCHTNGTVLSYGTLGQCISRQEANCVTALSAPSTGATAAFYEACASALPGESCQAYLANNPVAACISAPGGIASGAACTYSAQCATGFCAVVKGTNCGTCQNSPSAGDPCTTIGCGRDQTCTPNQVCEPWVAAGGTCDTKNNICLPGYACVIAANMASGTCQARVTTVGATCDSKRQTGPDCDPYHALFCDATTLKCVAYTYGAANATCGSTNSGHNDVLCSGGGQCVNPGGGAACVAVAADGADCDTSAGPPCLGPARCVTGGGGATGGTCTLPDPTMCM